MITWADSAATPMTTMQVIVTKRLSSKLSFCHAIQKAGEGCPSSHLIKIRQLVSKHLETKCGSANGFKRRFSVSLGALPTKFSVFLSNRREAVIKSSARAASPKGFPICDPVGQTKRKQIMNKTLKPHICHQLVEVHQRCHQFRTLL